MQSQAIRVESLDRGKALDPMARLDYGARYVFDNGVPNIRYFGRIHPDYLASLYGSYNLVWSIISGAQPATPVSHQMSATASTAGSVATIVPNRAARPSLASPDSGPITVDEMRALLQNYYNHARRNQLPLPDQQLTALQIQGLAANAQSRAVYLHRLRSLWRDDEDDDDDDDEFEQS